MSNYFSMEAFDYDDIQLVPNKGIIKSRRDADTSVKFGNRTFKIPVVPANMESVIDDNDRLRTNSSSFNFTSTLDTSLDQPMVAFHEFASQNEVYISIHISTRYATNL